MTMSVRVPGQFKSVGQRDGVWSGAFTHPVKFVHWNIQAQEEFQCFFGNGGSSGVALFAAIQTQSLPHLPEHQALRQTEVQRGSWHSAVSDGENRHEYTALLTYRICIH